MKGPLRWEATRVAYTSSILAEQALASTAAGWLKMVVRAVTDATAAIEAVEAVVAAAP